MTGEADSSVVVTGASRRRLDERQPRGFGLSIALWLVMGFALVIAAFVTGSLLAKHGTRVATDELVRVQGAIEPLTRTARELGESAAAFDRAVLAFLGTDSEENRAALVAAGERLSNGFNHAPDADADDDTTQDRPLGADIAEHQALGFRLAVNPALLLVVLPSINAEPDEAEPPKKTLSVQAALVRAAPTPRTATPARANLVILRRRPEVSNSVSSWGVMVIAMLTILSVDGSAQRRPASPAVVAAPRPSFGPRAAVLEGNLMN